MSSAAQPPAQPKLRDTIDPFIAAYGKPIDQSAVDDRKHAVYTFQYPWWQTRVDRLVVNLDTDGTSAVVGLFVSDAPPTGLGNDPEPSDIEAELRKFLPPRVPIEYRYVPRPNGGALVTEYGSMPGGLP